MRLAFLISLWILAVSSVATNAVVGEESLRYIGANPQTGTSQAVVVDDLPLVHTAQLVARDAQGRLITAADAAIQTDRLLDQVAATITAAGGTPDRIVKINVYLANRDAVASVDAVLAKRFNGEHKPATSYVVTRLPHEGCLVAMDAVAMANMPDPAGVALQAQSGSREATSSILPRGSRIYVAGQAEKGANLAEATRRTLQSLQATLQFLGRQNSDIVQLKSFLSPMSNVTEAQREMAAFFGDKPTPPSVWVEWTTPLIEIELIAWGGERNDGPAVEFLTPPGMTASPVYSRVTRTNSDRHIYLAGLFARQPAEAAGEVTDIFGQLTSLLKESGSDLRHLVKATYYCSTNDTSSKLNELRPKYYDPMRPPSASKAMVQDVGRADRGLTIDMIAVPSPAQ